MIKRWQSLEPGMATREAYGRALADLGAKNPKIVVLDADLSKSTYTSIFGKAHKDRFFDVGIAEANLVSVAAGLAAGGFIPFASSFASFLVCKGYEQLRVSVAYMGLNCKFVGSHGGISLGEDGPSQQSIEDVALAASLPGFTVAVPADEVSTDALVHEAAVHQGPVYLRVGRPRAPKIYGPGERFSFGRAKTLSDGSDVTVIANGLMVGTACQAAELAERRGIHVRVIDCHTAKPLDEATVEIAAKETGAIVVAEEHLIRGGLGSAVAQVVVRRQPVPMEFVGLQDTFAESGTPEELFRAFGLTVEHLLGAIFRVLERKAAPVAV
ncbi:MAG: transketolase family protein [Candidatus Rokubacteria bacterium]|nr:transketolase family protein [Candidatus Rokubacteria bacterium]